MLAGSHSFFSSTKTPAKKEKNLKLMIFITPEVFAKEKERNGLQRKFHLKEIQIFIRNESTVFDRCKTTQTKSATAMFLICLTVLKLCAVLRIIFQCDQDNV